MNIINWLIEWYKGNCDEDWEHCYGIKIETLDNPGWMIDIDLSDTGLEEKHFKKVQIYINDNDWINCEVKERIFKGCGSIDKFEEILKIFKTWVELD